MMKVLRKSGLSTDGTYLPACIHPCLVKDPRHDLEEGRREAEMVMFGAVQVGEAGQRAVLRFGQKVLLLVWWHLILTLPVPASYACSRACSASWALLQHMHHHARCCPL